MKIKFRTPWFLHRDEKPTENDTHSINPSSVSPFERKKLKAACALNMCMVSLSQIVDYQDLEVLKMEYDSILNNLNLEAVVKDDALLNALQSIMDACHFYILHARDKEILKKKQQARLKGALGNALGGGNVIAIFGSGNPWAIAAGAVTMIGVGAVNYKSQRDKAKLENEVDEWHLERSALEQLHNLRRTLFETAWRFAEKYNYPDSYRLTEKQISVYNDIIRNPDPQTRYESLWLIRDNFRAYPMFWYYLGRAALETSDAFRPDAKDGERKRQISYGEGDSTLQEVYRKKAIDAYETFKKCHMGNELMREDVLAASAYLDHAQLCDPANPRELCQILDDVNRAYRIAPLDEEVVQLCAFRYLQLFELSDRLKAALHDGENRRLLSDEDIASIPKQAVECLRFLVSRGFNAEVNGRALSRVYKLTNNHEEYLVVKSLVSRRCPLVYQRLFPWDDESFKEDWKRYLDGPGVRTTAFNLFYGCMWLAYKEFFCALHHAKSSRSNVPLKSLGDKYTGDKPTAEGIDSILGGDSAEDNPMMTIVEKVWQQKTAPEGGKSLEELMKIICDASKERDPWKLWLRRREAEYIPSEFEMREKELMERVIKDAKSAAESFVQDFRKMPEVARSFAFSYESVQKEGLNADEPRAFVLLSEMERKAERLRQEIQDLLGGDSSFWYPDPKFSKCALPSNSMLRKQSESVASEIMDTLHFRNSAFKQISTSFSEQNKIIDSITNKDVDNLREIGIDC